MPATHSVESAVVLSDRQIRVLRAVVAAFVGAATPVGSATVSHLLSVPLSAASIRTTMSELSEMGLISKPHSSSGRIPTEAGFRLFINNLLQPQPIEVEQQRRLRHSFGDIDVDGAMHLASQVLSESTRQLGFVLIPRLDRVRLRQVALVRVASSQLLVVLVTESGRTHNRTIQDSESGNQPELDRIARVINERVRGRTLSELRESLEAESRTLRNRAGSLLARAIVLGQKAVEVAEDAHEAADLLVATRLALLEQPEFSDPERLRELFSALETNERVLSLMGDMLDGDGVKVALGGDIPDPGLRDCALVTAPYGMNLEGADTSRARGRALGVLGVIGPSRMDYGRIIPLVGYFSQLVSEKFNESGALAAPMDESKA